MRLFVAVQVMVVTLLHQLCAALATAISHVQDAQPAMAFPGTESCVLMPRPQCTSYNRMVSGLHVQQRGRYPFLAAYLLTAVFDVVIVLSCSKLWGCAGELYDMPNSLGSQRLLDWSYAGYMAGETPIPKTPVVTSVLVGAVAEPYRCRPACVAHALHSLSF